MDKRYTVTIALTRAQYLHTEGIGLEHYRATRTMLDGHEVYVVVMELNHAQIETIRAAKDANAIYALSVTMS